MNEQEAFALLISIPHLGAIKIRMLVERFGSAAGAIRAPIEQISQLPGFDPVMPYWHKAQKDPAWKKDLALASKFHVKLIPFTDTQFPKALLEISDHPALLYVQGNLKPEDQRSLAVVGTRQASIYGNEMAASISGELAAAGYTVVSGLARGIDTSAHQGALAYGRTLAVIGSGLAHLYPPENRDLAHAIVQNGALISEFPMDTPPDRQNFPQRNRIVSGMTKGTLLIEAPIKSGAMITMDRARLQKKKLFALPGRADNDNFRGNHMFIKSGQAQLIEKASDIIGCFEELFPVQCLRSLGHKLDREEQTLYDQMPNEEVTIDRLAILVGQPVQQTSRILMSMTLKKAIKEFPGKIYKKI